MPHTKQTKKRVRTDEARRLRNKARSSAMRTQVKKVLGAIEAGEQDAAKAELILAQKRIDKCAKKNIIHPNNAARKKAALARKVNELSS